MNPDLTANQEKGLRDVLVALGRNDTGLAVCYRNTSIEHVMDSDLLTLIRGGMA